MQNKRPGKMKEFWLGTMSGADGAIYRGEDLGEKNRLVGRRREY